MNIIETIKEIQTVLGIESDGVAGPQTWTAIHKRIVGTKTTSETPPFVGSLVDSQSEKNIVTLLPEIGPYARSLVTKAAQIGITVKVISGTRTYAEQDALYAQGRTKPGSKVTNARGGYSNHNFGIAFDIGIFEGSAYLDESPKYKVVGALGMELGLDWGGNWKTIKDEPHFQLRPVWAAKMSESAMLEELRERVSNHKAIFP